ncbi:MAG TPA: TonB family protein [Longimicrobium sp.]|nr:TonB family protein [Longimicrobium sp.]
MPLVNCPECGGSVSSAAPACPHCGHPSPGRPAAPTPPPSRGGGVSAGWIILGFLAVGALGLALLGWGVYRFADRFDTGERRPEELVDFDSMPPRPSTAGPEERPDYVDSAQEEIARERAGTQPPDSGTYELSALEVQPELLNRDEVVAALSRNYPPLLRDAGVGGTVRVRFRITRTGGVDASSIEVLESTHEAFTDAAAHVAREMRFRPGRHNGSAVPVWVALPVTFQIAR